MLDSQVQQLRKTHYKIQLNDRMMAEYILRFGREAFEQLPDAPEQEPTAE